MPVDKLEVVNVPIDSISPHPQNPRRGDVALIADSIRRHGLYTPLVVQASTGHVLAGNHRLLALRSLQRDAVDVVMVDVDDDEARRILLVDNRSSDLGSYDSQELAELLQSLGGDLEGTGYQPDDLEDLLAGLEAPDLDDLFGEHGHPTDEDTLVKIVLRVQPDAAALWRTAGDTTGMVDDVARDTALVRAAYTQLVGDPGGHNTDEHGQ